MPLEIVRNDITKMTVDAIVNAANSALKMGDGVCSAIFTAAGADELQSECDKTGRCNVGEAVITRAYKLPSRFIIHTVGPIWQGGNDNEATSLANCYRNSLELAQQYNCDSIAFPLISSGIFGYPKADALKIATLAIGEFLKKNEMMVYLVVFDNNSLMIGESLFATIEKFIDDRYVEEHTHYRQSNTLNRTIRHSKDSKIPDEELLFENKNISFNVSEPFDESREYYVSAPLKAPNIISESKKKSLKDQIAHRDESFAQMLLRLIDEKGMTDVETYKKANIDRKLFSKIRTCNSYSPSKATAIAFAIALNLSLDDTKDLLGKAGYSLSHSSVFDIVVEFFIVENNYDIYAINEALFSFDQPLLV